MGLEPNENNGGNVGFQPHENCEPKSRGLQARHPSTRNHRRQLASTLAERYPRTMYEEFHVTDRWSGEDLYCKWKANIVAIATRHADAVDVRFEVNNHPMWIALPCTAWVEHKKRTGMMITDQLAAQIAGRYLKQLIEEGYDSRREVYTMSVPEVLEHLDAVVAEAKARGSMPALPVGI